ncbi:MAG: cyclic nucleotide-binding domain-containing protein [Hyphomicrobiales bacterium]|nr:cyclic nucleotide-binding domain-containing protein [Hyphomicrobiales bacterium]MCP5373866.1 cyclic nucleotide-binding domain-containing protein [Hyphomicrobiales bacterium]
MVKTGGMYDLLAEHPFFAGMDKGRMEVVAGCAMNERFEAGQYIFHEGESADKFYLVRHGMVALEFHVPGREQTVLDTVHKGEIFGWSWMVSPYTWSFDARAVELCRLVSLDAKCLRGKFDADNSLGYDLLRRFIPVMAERLSAARMQMIDMYGQPPDRK